MSTQSPMEKGYYWKNPHGRKIMLSLLLVFVGTVALDQITKRHVQSSLLVWEDPTDPELFRGTKYPVGVIGNPDPKPGDTQLYMGLDFQYSRNRGAAFSMLADLPDKVRVPFFHGVTLLAVVMIGIYLRSTPRGHHFTRLGLIFILSGAIGNFLDRLRLGYVVDFIDVDWNFFGWKHDFAIFNIADVAINVGVICLLIEMLVKKNPEEATENGTIKSVKNESAKV